MTTRPTTAQRPPGWRLGSVRGVPVYLAPSWLAVAALFTILFLPTVQAAAPGLPSSAAVAAATSFPILLFASVFAHELAHGVVATAFGVRVREYVLSFWGGHTSFGSDLRGPGVSAAVSAAGPLANLVLAGAGWLVLQAIAPGLGAVIVAALVWANLVVAVFNLLPGNPLDGGRILEALIWRITGDRNTGAIGAGWVGRVLAVGIVVVMLGVPLLRGARPTTATAIWAVLIAVLIWNGATQSVRMGRARRSAAGFDLRPLLRPAVVLGVGDVVADVPDLPWGVRAEDIVVVDEAGDVVAIADREALAAVPPAARGATPVSAIARAMPPVAVVTAFEGADAMAQIARGLSAGVPLVAVSPHGVLGTVDREALLAALRVASRP